MINMCIIIDGSIKLNAITQLRKLLKLSKTGLAKILGVHRMSIHNWEISKASPALPTCEKIIELGKKNKFTITLSMLIKEGKK